MKQLGLRPPKTTAPSRTPIAPKATPANTSAPQAAAPTSNPPPRATVVAASPSAARKSPPPFKKPVIRARREPSPAISKVESTPATKRKLAKTTEAVAVATKQTAIPAARAVSMKREPVTPVQVATPSPVFRNIQARKAEAIAKTKLAAETAPLSPAAAPAPAKRAETPAALPPVTASAKNPTQECPSCTATVPAELEKCRCGYTFSQSTKEVPALTLDAAALAILTDGIAPKNTSRRR
jgi:hypothetical protein